MLAQPSPEFHDFTLLCFSILQFARLRTCTPAAVRGAMRSAALPQNDGLDGGLELREVAPASRSSGGGNYRDDLSGADAADTFSRDDDEEVGFSYRPAVKRQNQWFFGISFVFLALAVVVYVNSGREPGVSTVIMESPDNGVTDEGGSDETTGQIKWKNGEQFEGGNHHPWAPWNKHRNGPLGGKPSKGRESPDSSSPNIWWVEPRSHDKVTLGDGVRYEILEEMLHDHNSFTQGLTYNTDNGLLYESVGLYKKSKVRQLNPKTGEVIKSVDMDRAYFAEGMTYIPGQDKLIQITWKAKTGFIYNATTLETMSSFSFTTTFDEGWGITYDPRDKTLIVSDGSEYLHFWDPDNPGVDKKPRVKVTRQNPNDDAKELNELEYVNGRVVANVWYKDCLLVIDPETGECVDEYDFKDLWPKNERKHDHADVLNGVSVSGEDGVLYVTGKLWKKMFRLKLK